MFLKQESRKDVKGLSDLIDYFAVVDNGIVLTSTGLYVAGWEFVGPDMDAFPPEESWQIANRLANRLKLGRGWTVQCDLIRGEHPEYCPDSDSWPDPISYLIEQERRARFTLTGEAGTRASRYFLTLSYEPAAKGGQQAARWMFASEGSGKEGPGERSLALFSKRLAEVDALLRNNLARVQRLQSFDRSTGEGHQLCDRFLQYVRQCIGGEDYPFALPETPVFLNQYLATDDFTGGAEPQLGDPLNVLVPGKRIAVIAIDSFPELSFAGILRHLDSIPFISGIANKLSCWTSRRRKKSTRPTKASGDLKRHRR